MKSTWVKTVAVDKRRNEWVEKWVKVRDWSDEKRWIWAFFYPPNLMLLVATGLMFWILVGIEVTPK